MGIVGIVVIASIEKVYTFSRLLPIFKQFYGFENRHFQNSVSAILKKRKIAFAILFLGKSIKPLFMIKSYQLITIIPSLRYNF